MLTIFTDLDGTLLDHNTYAFEAARSALELLSECGIPLIFVSSKTRSELDFWRREIGNIHPFVVENGGGVIIPKGYFDCSTLGHQASLENDLIGLGTPYTDLVAELKRVSRAARCPTRGFNEMTPAHIARQFSLTLEQAVMAKQREFDEPFLVLDQGRKAALLVEIERAGLNCCAGGRLLHLSGRSDKGTAVRELIARYQAAWGPVRTIGLGDAMNDLPMLRSVDLPVIIRSPMSQEMLRQVPHATVTEAPGPQGWNEAVLRLITPERVA